MPDRNGLAPDELGVVVVVGVAEPKTADGATVETGVVGGTVYCEDEVS